MNYAQHNSNLYGRRSKKKNFALYILLIVLMVVVFIVLLFFLKNDNSETTEAVVLEDFKNNDNAEDQTAKDVVITEDDVFLEEIDFFEGFARRGFSGDLFTHVIVADLPAIDLTTHFYEGWLVNPKTLDFFSTGELFARQDGKWGLVWESQEHNLEYFSVFSRIVITLEPRDGDGSPSTVHVQEVEFK
ncbi:hypothetical protein KJ766_00085 [Patescibacteria group bacterium]|nr:hypothetical protein [Patescibacteria group bacterium]